MRDCQFTEAPVPKRGGREKKKERKIDRTAASERAFRRSNYPFPKQKEEKATIFAYSDSRITVKYGVEQKQRAYELPIKRGDCETEGEDPRTKTSP